MKVIGRLMIVSILIVSGIGYAAGICSDEDVALAQELYDTVEAKFESGTTSSNQVISANIALLDVKFCAGQMGVNAYCSRKNGSLIKIIERSTLGVQQGTSLVESAANFLKELVLLRNTCNIGRPVAPATIR